MILLRKFGTQNGRPLLSATLTAANSQVTILSLGAITQDWQHAGQTDTLPMVLGYENPAAYQNNPAYFGAIVGRVANRCAYGRFSLAGQNYTLPVNQPPHHLHGGPQGLQCWNFKLWADTAQNALTLTHRSPDGHMGYPGNVDFRIQISLNDDCLTYEMNARPDRPTPINLAQHSYYNLGASPTCRAHTLELQSTAYAPADLTGLPTGQIRKSAGSRYDFATPRVLQQADPASAGYDVYMLADPARDQNMPLASLSAAGRRLKLWSDQPGLQLYDAMHLTHISGGHGGRAYQRFAGLALEPQAIPNILNMPQFGTVVCTQNQPYHQVTSVEITTGLGG